MRTKVLLTTVLVGGLLVLGACEEKAETVEAVRPIKAMQVGAATAIGGRWWPGRARATQRTNLAFEVAGRMVQRPVEVGDPVKKGQLLAALDPRDFANSLEQAKAQRKREQALYERVKRAAATGSVSQQELTDAEARLEVARAEVKIKQKAFNDAKLIAPHDGTISATYVENFENVQAKELIMRLLDTSSIEMVIDIPETLISYAPYVTEVRIRYDTIPGREFTGQIKEVSNEASEETRTYPVTLIMNQPEDVVIKPGMAGQATGSVDDVGEVLAQGHVIPIAAVFSPDDTNQSYVWVVDEMSMTVSPRQVTTAELTDNGIRITEGLESGEIIATAGANYLQKGQKVRFLDDQVAAKTQAETQAQ